VGLDISKVKEIVTHSGRAYTWFGELSVEDGYVIMGVRVFAMTSMVNIILCIFVLC
jgi:hypothetical protein